MVLAPSMLLSAFGHCLCIILYKPGLRSTSTLVQISCCVLVLSPCHHITVFIPIPSKFHLSSVLLHLTFLSIPPKLISDLEPRLELYSLLSPVIDHCISNLTSYFFVLFCAFLCSPPPKAESSMPAFKSRSFCSFLAFFTLFLQLLTNFWRMKSNQI